MNLSQIKQITAALVVAATVNACSGIGDGVELESLSISSARIAGSNDTNDLRALGFECLTTALTAFGNFSNSTRGNFTDRVTWSSSDETVVKVSNGDISAPNTDGLVFTSGVLVPVKAGTAVVTADFVGLTESIDVEIRNIPANGLTLTPSSARIARNTTQIFVMTADLGGTTPEDIASAVTWKFETPDLTVATIGVTGIATGISVGAPLTLAPSLDLCAGSATAPTARTATLEVAKVEKVLISKEYTGTNQLLNATSELFSAQADFDSDDVGDQSLTNNVTWSSSDATKAAFVGNQLVSLAAGTVDVTARFGADTDADTVLSAPINIEVVDGVLTALRLSPDTASIDSLGVQLFTAEADFTVGNNTLTQSVQRHAAYSTSDLAVAFASSTFGFQGQVFSQRRETVDQTVDVTALLTNNGNQASDTSQLTIKAAQCLDGLDNDGDGFVDFTVDADGVPTATSDPGCNFASDISEDDNATDD